MPEGVQGRRHLSGNGAENWKVVGLWAEGVRC